MGVTQVCTLSTQKGEMKMTKYQRMYLGLQTSVVFSRNSIANSCSRADNLKYNLEELIHSNHLV